MPGIDFRQARQEIRLAEVLALLNYQPRQRQGRATAWAVSGAPLAVGNDPLFCGPPG